MSHWLLALDTATGPCSVAVLEGTQARAHLQEEGKVQQARKLVPMVEAALHEAGIWYHDISQIISTIGPGSFTGLRVGLAMARASGFAAGVPVQGVTTLATLAYAAKDQGTHILALINAGKQEAYFQLFQAEPAFQALSEPMLGTVEAIRALLQGRPCTAAGFSDLLANEVNISRSSITHPDANAAGLLATHYPTFLMAPEPLYIRPPDAKPAQPFASICE